MAKKKSKKKIDKPVKSVSETPKVKKQVVIFPKGFWKNNWIPAVLFVVVSFALYISSVNFDYVLDDKIVFTENDFVQKGFSGIGDILAKETFTGYFGEQKDLVAGGRYRPLSLVTFAIEKQLFGQKEAVSHFFNVLFYAFNILLLYRVLFLFFPTKEDKENKWYWSIPFIATLLFLLHPLHTEVVANVKGRDEIMTMMGALAATYYTFKYIDTDKILYLLLSGIMLFLGLLSKENAITFLAVIPIAVYFFTKASFKKNLLAMIPLLIATGIFLMLRTQAIGYLFDSGEEIKDLMNNPFADMTDGQEIATIVHTLGIYFKLSFFPHPLTHDYYPYHIPIMNWGDISVILSTVLYGALGLFAIWGLIKKNIFAFCIILYLATLSITSNLFFPVGTFMNERFIYISSLGACIALAYLFYQKIPDWFGSNQKVAQYLSIGLFAIYALGFTGKTVWRVPAWKNAMSLNSTAIKISKNSARANTFMGTALFEEYKLENDRETKKKLMERISFHINKSLEIHPRYGSAITMKAGVLAEEYKYDQDIDKLLDGFFDVITLKSNLTYVDTYMDYLHNRADDGKLINWYYKTGTFFIDKRGQKALAAKYFKKGLELSPNNPQLKSALQRVQ